MKTTIIYKEEDRFQIQADFYSVPQQDRPVIVYIHGGGLYWGSREDIKKEQIEFYQNAGYNLFSIDYRLAPESKLPDIQTDIQDALRWLHQEGPRQFDFNPENIAVIGGSAGAYLALCAGTCDPQLRAIVAFYGYGDLTGDWAVQPSPHYQRMTPVPRELAKMLVSKQIVTVGPIEKRYALYMYARQQGVWVEEVSNMNPYWEKDKLLPYCPVHHVHPSYPPTLLLHGTLDEDVPYEQSQRMLEALGKAGVESRLITIPNGKHVFDDDWQNPLVQDAFQQVAAFLKKHLE